MITLELTPAVRKGSSPVRRNVRLDRIDGVSRAALILEIGAASCNYWLTPVPSEIGGQGWRLEKFWASHGTDTEAGEYHVLLAGRQSSCECRGFLRHGHCKHLDALQALVASGQL
jgi:hypothetical protein